MKRNVAALLVVLFLLCGRPLRAKAESESSAAENECRITGLSVLQTADDGVQVEVVFTAGEQAELVVALYDEADDRVMLACGAQEVDAGQEKCEIFAVWKNRAYSSFKVAAYLIEQNREILLCPSAYILQSGAAEPDAPGREDETEESAGGAATQGSFADCVKTPYENAYLFACTLAQQDQQGCYLTDPFANESLLYIAQRSGEELLTFSMEIKKEALVICNPCGFTDAPILLQEAEESAETTGPEESKDASGGADAAPEEGNPDDGDSAAQGVGPESVDETADEGNTGSGTLAMEVSQSMISSGSASSGTQALWMAAAGAGIFAAAAVAKKVLFARNEERMIRIDLQIGRWVMWLSDHAAVQPAQQGRQSSAPAEEQAAAANG
jgi:hypothetical protein